MSINTDVQLLKFKAAVARDESIRCSDQQDATFVDGSPSAPRRCHSGSANLMKAGRGLRVDGEEDGQGDGQGDGEGDGESDGEGDGEWDREE